MASDTVVNAPWRHFALPQIVDNVADERPDRVYGSWPVDQHSYSAGVRHVTYAQLANIVNGLASWLVKELGPDKPGEVLAYVGPNDVRFTALVLATMKTGHKLFLTSPRNSPIAHRKLFGSLKCETLITPDPTLPPTQAILEALELCRPLTIPSIDDLLSTVEAKYTMHPLDVSLSETLFIIHTSGSTGIPKPLNWTQRTAMRHIEASSRKSSDGPKSIDEFVHGKRILSTLPPFHGAGLLQHLLYAIPFGNSVMIPATAGAIVTAQGVVDALKQTPADIAVMVPSVVAELSQNPELLDFCSHNLLLILYIGGDLPQAVGDRVASRIRLRCWWGASEVGMPQQMVAPELESYEGSWHYVRFHPEAGATFDKVNENLYELVISRDEKLSDTQTSFTIGGFEDLTEYRTKDLFEPHPHVPDAWRWCARADDIIVFLNGEKTNPVSFENHLSKHPDIEGAIVFGDQRFEAGVLIELRAENKLSAKGKDERINSVWPSIEEANRDAPTHARIAASHVLFTTPDMPLLRTPKGTVMRKANLGRYAQVINELYQSVESARSEQSADFSSRVSIDDLEAVVNAIQLACKESTALGDVGKEDNLLVHGIDSLQVLRLCRNLRSKIGVDNLKPTTVYSNPSPIALAKAIQTAAKLKGDLGDELERGQKSRLEKTLADFTSRIDQLAGTQPGASTWGHGTSSGHTCIVTGTTGSIGSYILRSLIDDENIAVIYCLNRGPDSAARQGKHNAEVDSQLPTTFPDKVHFVEADLSHATFNLDPELFEKLSSSVTLIVHNACYPIPILCQRRHEPSSTI
ncbi:hypothetical protein O1611_g3931 [Lasiodiplodia mahajangana]|uniref:Uncharacterized protein n=1 Tax=Lasiodiplodia mahajangana TaxID=1108764 RepID=A0ACC2JR80_9PEZI|nr:hypothetical protein O1611_g3931 [Lasiodiplodia mahajangana]